MYAVAVEGWNDLAVLVDSTQLSELKCSRESEGLASHGWSCLFRMMPHLCMFETREVSFSIPIEAISGWLHPDRPIRSLRLGIYGDFSPCKNVALDFKKMRPLPSIVETLFPAFGTSNQHDVLVTDVERAPASGRRFGKG